MNRLQEVANALTMLLPFAVAARSLMEEQPAFGEWLAAAAILIHFPFSFCYHVSCAYYQESVHPVEGNFGLQLDLAFIHVSSALMSLATSGSLPWFGLNALLNGLAVYRIATWSSTAGERRLLRGVGVLAYILPILVVDARLFLRSLLIFLSVGFSFALNGLLAGWGHALSHVLLAPFAKCILSAAELAPALF